MIKSTWEQKIFCLKKKIKKKKEEAEATTTI